MNPFDAHIEHDPHAWRKSAACIGLDVDTFYTTRGEVYDPEAVACCEGCPVRTACLDDALAMPEAWDMGLRGGVSERVRLRMRTARRAERRAG